jgi:hypothetical protein
MTDRPLVGWVDQNGRVAGDLRDRGGPAGDDDT